MARKKHRAKAGNKNPQTQRYKVSTGYNKYNKFEQIYRTTNILAFVKALIQAKCIANGKSIDILGLKIFLHIELHIIMKRLS